jgi:hypothetical protein
MPGMRPLRIACRGLQAAADPAQSGKSPAGIPLLAWQGISKSKRSLSGRRSVAQRMEKQHDSTPRCHNANWQISL